MNTTRTSAAVLTMAAAALSSLVMPTVTRAQDCNTNGIPDATELGYNERVYYRLESPKEIWYVDLPGGPHTLFKGDLTANGGVRPDFSRRWIYWNVGNETYRANLDGGNAAFFLTGYIVAFLEDELLYIDTSVSPWQMKRCDPDGSNSQLLFTNPPGDICYYDGFFYNSDWAGNRIARRNRDGTGLTYLVTSTPLPLDISVEPVNGHLVWWSAEYVQFQAALLQSDLLGGNVTTTFTFDVTNPIQDLYVASDVGSIYLSHWSPYIQRCNLQGQANGGAIPTPSRAIGVAAVPYMTDCNTNGVLDACELNDCNTNGQMDECEGLYDEDCNTNGFPDLCDAITIGQDDDADMIVDACDTCPGLFNPEQGPWTSALVNGSNTGLYNSLRFDNDGKATLAYYLFSLSALGLWHDTNGDLIVDSSERRVIDNAFSVGEHASLAFDATGKAAASYYRAGNGDLKFWHDNNGDFVGQSAEVHTIVSTGFVGPYTSLAYDAAGLATIAYYSESDTGLELWHDIDGDNAFDAGEVQIIDTLGDTGLYNSLAYSPTGVAHVAYYSASITELKLWRDNDGDFAVDAGEIKSIDTANDVGSYPFLAFDEIGRVTIAYYDATNGDLKVFHDLDGDATTDPGEVNTVLVGGDVGRYASLVFDRDGSAVVACYRANVGDLIVWRDLNQNYMFDLGEVTNALSTGDVGAHASLAIHPGNGSPLIAYRDEINASCRIARALDWDMDGICVSIDPCPLGAPSEIGDLDADTDIDGDDLALFLIAFGTGQTNPAFSCVADSDGDGSIDAADYAAWLDAYRDFIAEPLALPPLPSNVGDLNLDGDVDGDDIAQFVAAVANPGSADIPAFLLSDMNADGTLDGTDVTAFASVLVNGS